MNRAGAIAGPLAGLGMGMMGLDPISLGLKAGMGAYGAGGGLMGGAAAGLGVAAAAAIPMAAMSYAGGQVMAGAGQQQNFNSNMRSAFGFNQPFGQGFSTSQMGAIGSDIRGMAGQVGGGGEMSSFRELASLATNMGRMGMGTGIRDVQQFRQKFTEMVQTVKTIATELGTSLEQAQQAMAAMRGSGVFRNADQVKMATQMRNYSVAGGVATAELTSMASIGSQISRSVGGRGNAGAFAGMRTLGTIGSALQQGVLSDEDIYNATGMYGAEGRQALATRQMENSAGFLKSNKGRYFLASIAGANGQLDAGSVSSWMGGGMDVEETRGQAHKNLRGIGRANFIRNEGRLRGAAMEKFGGLMPAMAMQQWAQGKGVDINNMGDREMLFASRQLGMGMDEMEATLKEARNLPALMNSQQTEQQIDQSLRQVATRRRSQGIEGMKRQFEQAKEKVQGGLQQLGADFYTQTSDMMERWINKMSGTYVNDISRDAIAAYKQSGSLQELSAKTGLGRGNRFGSSRGGGTGGGAAEGFFGGGLMNFGKTDYDRVVEAGFADKFDAARMARPGQKQERALQSAVGFMNDFYTNMANPSLSGGSAYSAGFQDKLREAYAGGIGGKKGLDRANALQSFLETESFKGNTEARSALLQLQNAPDSQKGAIALGIEKSGKISTGSLISNGAGNIPSLFSGSYASRGEQAEAAGGILGRSKGPTGTDLVADATLFLNPITAVLGLAKGAVDAVGYVRDKAKRQKAGEFMLSGAGKDFTRALASGSDKEVEAAYRKVQDQYTDIQGQADADPTEMKRLQMMYAAAKVTRRAQQSGKSVFDKGIIDSTAKELHIDSDDLGSALTSIGRGFDEQRATNIRSIARSEGGRARSRAAEIAAAGFGSGSKLPADVRSYMQENEALSGLTGSESGTGLDVAEQREQTAFGLRQKRNMSYWGMDKASLLSDAKAKEAMGLFGLGQEERGVLSEKSRVFGQMRRGGVQGAVLQTLGLGVNRENLGMLKSGGAGAISALLDKAGLGDNADLHGELSAALGAGNKDEQARLLSRIQRGESAGGQALQDERKKQSEAEQRDKNPILDSMDKTLTQILEAANKTKDNTDGIKSNTTPHDNDDGSGTKDAPQAGQGK